MIVLALAPVAVVHPSMRIESAMRGPSGDRAVHWSDVLEE
jgi:hypothetical protein